MKINRSRLTFEGAISTLLTPQQEFDRLCNCCMLWEDTFYVDGIDIAERIEKLVVMLRPEIVISKIIELRRVHRLRHIPLFLIDCMFKYGKYQNTSPKMKYIINDVCSRPDMITDLLAIYWKNGKRPLPNQMKKGFSLAFNNFDEYQLAKWNRNDAIKLRDALFLSHVKPENKEKADLFKKLANNSLETPETWEVGLSGGGNKKEVFEGLIKKNKLGYTALLRNLRNMIEAGVNDMLIKTALLQLPRYNRPYPHQFYQAVKHAPRFLNELDTAMKESLGNDVMLLGKTVILSDVSGSTTWNHAKHSTNTIADMIATLSILALHNTEMHQIFSFSDNLVEIPPVISLGLHDLLIKSQANSGTYIHRSTEWINNNIDYDRIIIITDEQFHDRPKPPKPGTKGYIINVASYQHGVDYKNYIHINGFSENVIKFIHAIESDGQIKVD